MARARGTDKWAYRRYDRFRRVCRRSPFAHIVESVVGAGPDVYVDRNEGSAFSLSFLRRCSPTKRVQSFTCATADLRYDGWNVRLVDLPESRDRYGHLKATGGYSFTHVGQLTRIDGSAFAVQQAEKILESLRVFLSFARGAACSLPIRWGRGIGGEIVWRHFGSPVVDRWRQPHSWFDERHGELLSELFDPFCRVHNDERLRESLVRAERCQRIKFWHRTG